VHGEKANTDKTASNDWKVDRLKIILNDFSPDNIFNADKIGLYYRHLTVLYVSKRKCYLVEKKKQWRGLQFYYVSI
jgi:hypothetical protein